VTKFLSVLGTVGEIANWCGVARTAPYGWTRRQYIGSTTMAKLVEFSKLKRLDLDMNDFFVRREPYVRPPEKKYKPARKGRKRNDRG